jgi:hypothetical protein
MIIWVAGVELVNGFMSLCLNVANDN